MSKSAEELKQKYKAGYDKAISEHSGKTIEQLKWLASCDYPYRLSGFWFVNKRGERDYKVIATSFDKGYFKAIDDLIKKAEQEGER